MRFPLLSKLMTGVRNNRVVSVVFAIVCTILCLRPVPALAVGKVTEDPNAVPLTSFQIIDAEPAKDDRLNQEVSYQAKQGRLQEVANDLSRITGVSISSGKNTEDWPVRDIPVTISAKDIELGKLLQTIADVTHVALTSSKTQDSPRKYRFARTIKMENALAEYEKAMRAHKLDKFDREWAALETLASRPEEPGDDDKSLKFNNARAVGMLVKALGVSGRDSMKRCEQTILYGDTLPENIRQAMLEVVKTTRKRYEAGFCFPGSYHPNSKSTAQDIEQSEIILYGSDQPETIFQQLEVNTPAQTERGDSVVDGLSVGMRDALDYAKVPEATEKLPDPLGGVDINTKYTPVDYSAPVQEFLSTKVKLKAPEKMEGFPSLGDVLLALSDASGYTIVCEDFSSHRIDSRISSFPQGEMTVQAVLRLFRWDVDCLTDPDNKVVVVVSRYWIDHHKSLVPASFLSQMQSKLEKGIDLDDATPLTTLTEKQYYGWIFGSRDLSSLTLANFGQSMPLWALYDSLSPEEKLTAKSESGIPMSFFDSAQLVAACKKCNADFTQQWHERSYREKKLLPTDPKVLSALKMRITSKENWVEHKLESSGGGGISSSGMVSPVLPNGVQPFGTLKKKEYSIEIYGSSGEQNYHIVKDGPNGFPYYPLKWGKGENGVQATAVK